MTIPVSSGGGPVAQVSEQRNPVVSRMFGAV